MKKIYIFLARLLVAAVLSTLISMFFFGGLHPVKSPALAAGLLVFSYIFEQTRN